MWKKSSAFKKIVVTVTSCLLLQMTASTFIPSFSNVASATTLSSTLGTPDSKTGEINFPSKTLPGRASAKVTANSFSFENDVLSIDFQKNESTFNISSFVDKISNEKYDISTNSLFALTLGDGTVISPNDMTIKSQPTLNNLTATIDAIKLSDRDPGKQVKTVFNYNKNGVNFDFEWNVSLKNNSNNITQSFTFKNNAGTLNLASAKLIDLKSNTDGITPTKENKDSGAPINLKNLFFGIENPLSIPNVNGNSFDISIKSEVPLAQGASKTYTTGIGVSPEGQMLRAFKYYIERERVHFRRPELMYNTWWTFPMNSNLDMNEISKAFDMYKRELHDERGIDVNAFQIDDGWDDTKATPVWSINKEKFPQGFLPLQDTVQASGGSLGVWMSPFGGYPPTRGERTTANFGNYNLRPYDNDPQFGDEANLKEWGMFTLSDQRYYDRFKEAVIEMIDKQGVKCFKFDGVGDGLRNSGPSAANYKEYEKLLELTTEVREHTPDVFIYATVGTWASPYWLWYTDSIWRDEDDQGISGENTGSEAPNSGFSDRESWINYRDAAIQKHYVVENKLNPINELMTHGFTYSEHANYRFNNDLSKDYVKTSMLNDMKMLYALGASLGELHVQQNITDNLSEENQSFIWDNLAKNIKWSQNNFKLLSDNHWVGGDPNKGEVYGYASWSPEKAILTLRNPSKTAKTFTIDPAAQIGIPKEFEQDYTFVERDGVKEPINIKAGQTSNITLNPFEVVILEVDLKAPTNTIVTPQSTNTGNNGNHFGNNGNHNGNNGNHFGNNGNHNGNNGNHFGNNGNHFGNNGNHNGNNGNHGNNGHHNGH